MIYTKEELAQSDADRQYWEDWGRPLGLKLYGWTYQDRASFIVEMRPGVTALLEVSKLRAEFHVLDRLRQQLMEKAQSQPSTLTPSTPTAPPSPSQS